MAAGQADWPGLVTNCLGLVGIYLLAAAALYIEANLMARLALRGCNKLRRELFDKLQQVTQPVNQISMQMTTILSALAGAEHVFQVMDTRTEQYIQRGMDALMEEQGRYCRLYTGQFELD